mmetsp:Transcript_90238/g.291772  ORF Transcript_90238/g.291772 Transcript_90238/m.291772 type:complete len:200 (-) Transcript_90238:3792-4391(-)
MSLEEQRPTGGGTSDPDLMSREECLINPGSALDALDQHGFVILPHTVRKYSNQVSISKWSYKSFCTRRCFLAFTNKYSLPTSKNRTWSGSSPHAIGCRTLGHCLVTPVCCCLGGLTLTLIVAFASLALFLLPALSNSSSPLKPRFTCSAVNLAVPRTSPFLSTSLSSTVNTSSSPTSNVSPVLTSQTGCVWSLATGVTI